MEHVYTLNTHARPMGAGVDPRKAENQVKVGLRIRGERYICPDIGLVKAEHAAADGLVYVVCYRSSWAAIQRDIEESPGLIEAAKLAHHSQLSLFIADKKKIPAHAVSQDPAQWPADFHDIERQYPGSWQAEFFRLARRGPKQLIDAKLVEDNLPMPMTHEEKVTTELLKQAAVLSKQAEDGGAKRAAK